MPYLEVSVKEAVKIDETFEQAAQLALSYKRAILLSEGDPKLVDIRHEHKSGNRCCS